MSADACVCLFILCIYEYSRNFYFIRKFVSLTLLILSLIVVRQFGGYNLIISVFIYLLKWLLLFNTKLFFLTCIVVVITNILKCRICFFYLFCICINIIISCLSRIFFVSFVSYFVNKAN